MRVSRFQKPDDLLLFLVGQPRDHAFPGDKPPLLRASASELVRAADDCHELFELLRQDHPIWTRRRRRNGPVWNRFYTDHRLLLTDLGSALGYSVDETTGVVSLMKTLSWFSPVAPDLIKQSLIESINASYLRFRRCCFRWDEWLRRKHQRWLADSDTDELLARTDCAALFSSIAGQFFFRVAFPCFMLHGRWPGFVLREAARRVRTNLKLPGSLVKVD